MNIVENGVNYNIKRFNDLKVLNERLTKELKIRLDELDDQKHSFEDLNAMKNVSVLTMHTHDLISILILHISWYLQAQTEESMRIEALHKEISQVQRDIHEKMHYTRRLEHMLSRLKTNQV